MIAFVECDPLATRWTVTLCQCSDGTVVYAGNAFPVKADAINDAANWCVANKRRVIDWRVQQVGWNGGIVFRDQQFAAQAAAQQPKPGV